MSAWSEAPAPLRLSRPLEGGLVWGQRAQNWDGKPLGSLVGPSLLPARRYPGHSSLTQSHNVALGSAKRIDIFTRGRGRL